MVGHAALRGFPQRLRQTPTMAPMSLLVLDDARHVGLTAAELVANRIRARPRLRVLLPTGHTPRGLYAALRRHAADGSLPSDDMTVLGLDEYLGLGADDPRSFRADLDRELTGVPIGRREALDGAAADPDAEAARYEAVLDTAPVDLAVLGLGRDAHVAFNEPGSRPGDGMRRVALDPSTIAAAAADFGGAERVPREALTTGLRTLLAARELLLIVTGADKADALHATAEGPMAADSPASQLRSHPCLTILCDRAAAARLHRPPAATATTSPSSWATASPGSAPSTASPRTPAHGWRARSACAARRACARWCSPATPTPTASQRPSRWRASGPWPTCRSCWRSRAARPRRTRRDRCRSCWPWAWPRASAS